MKKQTQIKLIRKSKYYLFKYGIHRILPARGLQFLGYVAALSRWIENHRNLPYTQFSQRRFTYNDRFKLYRFIVDNEIANEPIDYLEFGVAQGHSFRWWVKNIPHKAASFSGFDTFTGLPEDWGPFKKGDMATGNTPPAIDDARCRFYQGLFQETLYEFLKSYRPGKKKIVHLDADLYSATLFVLTTLSPYLTKGDILIFDEFNVPLHEFKAFTDWVAAFYINYTVLGEVNNYFQVAIRIE